MSARVFRRMVCGLAMAATPLLIIAAQGADPYPRANSGANPYYPATQGRTSGTSSRTPAAQPARPGYPSTRQAAPQGTSGGQAGYAPRSAGTAASRPGYPATQQPRTAAAETNQRGSPKNEDSDSASEQANAPPAEQALKLVPVQADVDYSRPAEADVSKCKVFARKIDGRIGWVVEDPAGLTLRRFLDTNGDNKVDQWSYYRDGLEVYRDVDSDFDGKADQYRWFTTAGSRWGIDQDQDGTIDAWQAISPEEVTAEVVAALARQDATRFAKVVLSAEELKSLGLGAAKTQELAEKIGGLGIKFKEAARSKGISEKTKWAHFSGSQPGIVPAGTEGSTKDIQVYENVVAIAQTGKDHSQVQIGTLVKVGSGWRVIDAPQVIAEGASEQATAGFFFKVNPPSRTQTPSDAPNEKSQEILAAIQKLDASAAQATSPEEQSRYQSQRADLLERMADEATKAEDRVNWLRQMTDAIGAAVQSGGFPEGVKRLETLFEKVRKNPPDRELAAHVRFVQLTAAYGLSMQAKGADFAKIQAEWLKTLEEYVADYPKTADTAEAMLQLAIAQEFAGREEDAKKWYGQIVSNFPDSATAQKAAGAKTRLDSVGKTITLRGKGPAGQTVDLAKLRGQVVLIQYWATWCEPCKADMATLKELLGKYGKSLAVIGVNLDNSDQAMAGFLKEHSLPWAQIYEPGGLDSRLATELGILTLPTMILVDQEGRVVNRNITATELESELKRLVR